MSEKDYLKDISDIKNMMEKSSRYLSLSGLSSVLAGIYCLIGAGYYYTTEIETSNYSSNAAIIIFLIVTFLSIITTIYITKKRAEKLAVEAWSNTTKQLITSFATPFIIGSSFILILIFQEKYVEVIPLVPLVYGLSLIHAAKHTSNILKPLGIIHIIIAFLCLLNIENSFWYYTLGFGVTHFINGLIIYFKYDKKQEN